MESQDQGLTRARGESHRVPLCFSLARTGQINGSTTETEYSVMRIEPLRLLSRTINKNLNDINTHAHF